MEADVLESYIRQLIETSVEASMPKVPFAWQGGVNRRCLALIMFVRSSHCKRNMPPRERRSPTHCKQMVSC